MRRQSGTTDRTWTVLTVAAMIFLGVAILYRLLLPVARDVTKAVVIPGYLQSEYRQSNFPAFLEGRRFREQREEIRPLDHPSR
jgi:hypothetical protein